MDGARGVLFNIVGGSDLTMTEVDEAAKIISSAADSDANIIFGATIDESMHDQIRITVVATGFDQTKQRLQQFVPTHIQQPVLQPTTTYDPETNTNRYQEPSPQQPSQMGESQNGQNVQSVNNPQNLSTPAKPETEEDEWDIPAFLRQRN